MRRYLLCALVVTLGAGCSHPTTPLHSAKPTFTYVRTIGAPGSGQGQFQYPDGIAVDATNGLFVVDSWNRRVERFAPDGSFLGQWPAVGSMDGTITDYPGSIALDPRHGDLCLTYRGANCVIRYDQRGYPVRTWGGHGSGPGQFDQPVGVVVDDSGFVYVAEYGNSRIQKFTEAGVFVSQWNAIPTGPDYRLVGPSTLALDHRGHLYVLDNYHTQVVEYTTSGSFVRAIGSLGTANGQFRFPMYLAVDERGWLYVTDTELQCVHVFDDQGAFLTRWQCAPAGSGQNLGLRGITLSGGLVYVVECFGGRVRTYAQLPGMRRGPGSSATSRSTSCSARAAWPRSTRRGTPASSAGAR
jgi:tripartite motif-containing protein 71